MRGFPRNGFYVPDGRTEYEANLDVIDAVFPAHGGVVSPDGTIEQIDVVLNTQFSQDLPSIASNTGHLYIPQVFADATAMTAVLADSGTWTTFGDELISLATMRFDAPWHGVCFDLEGVDYDQRSQFWQFLYLLGYRLWINGLHVHVSVPGRYQSGTSSLDSYDYKVIARMADTYDVRAYDYPWHGEPPISLAPYWYVNDCIHHAIDGGLIPQRLLVGLGNVSVYWPITGQSEMVQTTHAEALQLTADHNSFQQWIESNKGGLVRERYADIGEGHIWLADGDTFRHRLELIESSSVAGAALFIPGMGDNEHWQVLREYR